MKIQHGRIPLLSFRAVLIAGLLSTFMTVDAISSAGDSTHTSGTSDQIAGQHRINLKTHRDLQDIDASGPTIDVWYGLTQSFGHIGTPQDQINILGNVSDPDGIKSLTYSLNSSAEQALAIGQDSRRLVNPGDFNVEIFYNDSDLLDGPNDLVISATDNGDNLSQVSVTVNYTDANTWPLPYTTDWGTAAAIQDEAQVVDGLWDMVAGGVRTMQEGYDRLIAIGDVDWNNYEVIVPITINETPGNTAGLGIMMRWNGHTDVPVSGWQPKSGWIPFGAVGWYRWMDDYFGDRLQIYGNEGHILAEDISGRKLVQGTTYIFKMRVESVPGQGSLYLLKVWEQGHSEPDGWDLMGQTDVGDPSHGSFLLLAHLVDATFGDVSVQELGTDTTNPSFRGDIHVKPGLTSAIVSWETNEPTTGKVYFGPTQSYSLGFVEDPKWDIKHSVLLTGLNVNAQYHYKVYTKDTSANSSNSSDLTFQTEVKASSSGIDSDDFNDCSINTDLWTFVDPIGDSTAGVMGGYTEDAWLKIGVPAGTDHDLWIKQYQAPRILQPANNADFEIEVKFESEIDEIFQLQGIVVEESQPDQSYIRFGFYFDGTVNKIVIFAAGYIDGIPTVKNDQYINSGNPLYMRVKRQGDTWTQKFSYNGSSWTTSRIFTYPIHVNAVGTYAGNAADMSILLTKHAVFSEDYHFSSHGGTDLQSVSSGAPSHNGYMDYFFNAAAPIAAEDGACNDLTISINPAGKGAVQKTPDKANYSCNEIVKLTAQPIYGWMFNSWQGGFSGHNNPVNLTMVGHKDITAEFSEVTGLYYLSIVLGD